VFIHKQFSRSIFVILIPADGPLRPKHVAGLKIKTAVKSVVTDGLYNTFPNINFHLRQDKSIYTAAPCALLFCAVRMQLLAQKISKCLRLGLYYEVCFQEFRFWNFIGFCILIITLRKRAERKEMKTIQTLEDKETVICRWSARLCVFVCGEPLQCGCTARCTQPVRPTPPLAHLAAYGETSGPPALLHLLMVLRLYRNAETV
jgi:hypothetical protein